MSDQSSMWTILLIALTLLSSEGLAGVPWLLLTYKTHEKRDSLPAQWTKRSRVQADAVLPVRIALKQRNSDLGHGQLMAVSDPASPSYGKHWTAEQVRDFFAPGHDTVRAVRQWLNTSGIAGSRHVVAGSRGHVQFEATVGEIESMLQTEYHWWQHTDTGESSISCDEYKVPNSLKDSIDFVFPGTGFHRTEPSRRRKRGSQAEAVADSNSNEPVSSSPSATANPSAPLSSSPPTDWRNCSILVTPECIKKLYGISDATTSYEDNDLGFYESQDTYDQSDLDGFFTKYAPNIPNGTHPTLQAIDGGTAPGANYTRSSGSETLLDLDVAYPIIHPQGTKLYQTYTIATALNTSGLFNGWLDALDGSYCDYDGGDDPDIDPSFPGHGWNSSAQCGIYKPASVMSISYAVTEADYPPAYLIRQCHEFMKLGLQGVSVVVASGDAGAAQGTVCLDGGRLNPAYPASCPYVTTVGATQITYSANLTGNPEVATDPSGMPASHAFSSGGGFSNIFARPTWQDAAVTTYLSSQSNLSSTTSSPSSQTFNTSGRAYPDISAIGRNIAIFYYNQPGTAYGTSASAPLIAAIVTRINGERRAQGKGTLGFLNPAIYGNMGLWNDVTEGYNLGCQGNKAFECASGWDPVTGLGTPKFEALMGSWVGLG